MKTSTLLVTVLGAAAAGVVVGLMIAPEKGSETRRILAEKAEDWKNKAGDLIKTGKEYVNDVASSLKSNGQKMEKEAENQFNRVSTDLG
jgi:gas vesicle protein